LTGGFPDVLDIAYRILDDQLVDVDGRRCGRADDIEFDGSLGEPPRLFALISGSGSWHRRFPRPLRGLGARIFGAGVRGVDVIRVPWDQVDEIGSVLKLKAKASELGLAQGDYREGERIARWPNS
jgi:sporulation protein YlmC with PRC-barrel domain